MEDWKKNAYITNQEGRFVVIQDRLKNVYWEPHTEEDSVIISPFPEDYLPQIGETFTILKGNNLFHSEGVQGAYQLKEIHSVITPIKILVVLVVNAI